MQQYDIEWLNSREAIFIHRM